MNGSATISGVTLLDIIMKRTANPFVEYGGKTLLRFESIVIEGCEAAIVSNGKKVVLIQLDQPVGEKIVLWFNGMVEVYP